MWGRAKQVRPVHRGVPVGRHFLPPSDQGRARCMEALMRSSEVTYLFRVYVRRANLADKRLHLHSLLHYAE